MKIIKFLWLAGLLFFSGHGLAQPFADEIAAFKKQDQLHPPIANSILFVGSSSFRKWTDINDYFPGYPIINRGFGGSSLPDLIRYAPEIIFPYHPKQVVIYCGENDFDVANSPSADTVFERFKTLFEMIRTNMPGENIIYLSIKGSPSRIRYKSKIETANLLIQTYLSLQQHALFLDVYHKMLTPEGNQMPEIYLADSLHMNAKGYAIWQKAIEPYLSK